MSPMQFKVWEHLPEKDIEFVLQVLGSSTSERNALLKLLADPAEAVAILDSESLLTTALESVEHLPISPRFYFYMLVRRSFLKEGIERAELADYVAGVLAQFCRTGRKGSAAVELLYSIDLLQEVKRASSYERFFIYSGAGNRYLFLTGMFPDYLKRREQRWGAPAITYYEQVAAHSFRSAGAHPLAREFDLGDVYHFLGEEFGRTRRVLNACSSTFGSHN